MKVILLILLTLVSATAQTVTLQQAVEKAIALYPQLKVNEEQVKASAASIQLARLAYLPKADAIAQVNRATRNNVYGMLLQQNVISPISGPPLEANAGTNVFGSAIGFLVSWEPFDFGLRRAMIGVSEAERRRAEASMKRTRFEVAALAADSYLTILAAEQAHRAALAGKARTATVSELVKGLVDSGLRPGVDYTRMEAEAAAVDNQTIQTEQAIRIAKVALGQLLQTDDVAVAPLKLLENPGLAADAGDLKQHPALLEQQATIAESDARQKALDRSYAPKFNTQATTYARGTGARADFTTGGAGSGLAPNIYNWGIGFTVSFPLLDLPGLRVKKEIETHRGRAEQARYEQLLRDLEGRRKQALVNLDAARRIAGNTPLQVKAAGMAHEQAVARYKAGLISMIEVADTQRALTAAEIDDAVARLSIWRAMLGVAIAEGDLSGFLERSNR